MVVLTHLTTVLAACLARFIKRRKTQKTRRARRTSAHTFQRKAQPIAIYLLGSVLLAWMVLHAFARIPALRVAFVSPAPALQTSGDGKGSGGRATRPLTPVTATDVCNPLDPTCFANAIASWASGAMLGTFGPLTGGILTDPLDIIFQTPPTDSYQNQVVKDFNGAFVDVLDAALACLLVIGAYNIIWGHHLRAQHTSLTELLPRAILVVGAVHFNLTFLGMFIDFTNDLCQAVLQVTSYHMLTDMIQSLLQGNVGLEGLLQFILVIVLIILVICLLIQRVGTIALIALLIIVAPLGLGCFLLPQTMRWSRLWLSTLSSALITQVLQVTALGLGGAFLASVGKASLLHLDQDLANALLAIGTLFLVLKIPGMLQTWALQPAADGSRNAPESTGDATSAEQGGTSGAQNAPPASSLSTASLGGGATTPAAVGGGAAGGTEAVAAAAVLV